MLFNNEEEWRAWLKRQKDDQTCISFTTSQPEKYPCWIKEWHYCEHLPLGSRWIPEFVYDGTILKG